MSEKLNNFGSTAPNRQPQIDTSGEQLDQIAISEASALSREICDYEISFAKQLMRSNGYVEQPEFETWEDLIGNQLQIIQAKINFGNLTLEQEAEARQYMVAYHKEEDLKKTVEAQSANFYREREKVLRQAITNSNDPNKDADLKYIQGYYASVIKHLDFKYMTRDEVEGYGFEAYESQRTRAHNNTIKYLNGLNDLARKYHTRPFTVRNFWPSDLRRKEDQTPAVAKVMRYDRNIVEEYYALAFSSEVQQRAYRQKRQESLGFY